MGQMVRGGGFRAAIPRKVALSQDTLQGVPSIYLAVLEVAKQMQERK